MSTHEFNLEWKNFDQFEKEVIIAQYRDQWELSDKDTSSLNNIFEEVQPIFVLGCLQGKTYCRFTDESEKSLEVLLNQYLEQIK